MKKGKEKFFIAQVGKTHGLRGDLKLHLHTDFPEQFKVGHDFDSSIGRLEISRVNLKKGTIAFRGHDRNIDSAKHYQCKNLLKSRRDEAEMFSK